MTQASDFRAFLSDKVDLDQRRIDKLSEHVLAIENFLRADREYKDDFTELIPQGSYAHQTIIRPVGTVEFDADVLLTMTERDGREPKDYIETLYTALGRSQHYRSKRSRKKRCVTIDYAGDFHVDVVPYIVTATGATYIANRATNQFEVAAPDQYTAWLEKQSRHTKGNLIKVVRLLKYLRNHKRTYAIPSVVLTTLLAKQVDPGIAMFVKDAYNTVPNTLRTISTALATELQRWPVDSPPYLADPGTGETLTDRWSDQNYKTFRDRFARHAQIIDSACSKDSHEEALPEWRELFGPDFGATALVHKSMEAITASASLTAPSEKFLPADFGIPMGLNPQYTCLMVGEVVPNRGFRNRPLPETGDLVTKGRSLVFRIRHCDVPEPYDVYWKVRNHGEEAESAHALRGDITRDDGTRRRSERTSYRGRHWVEAFIVKNGVCVASSRQAVIVR